MLKDEDVAVSFDPPEETRGSGELLEAIVAQLLATGAWEGIKAGVNRFRQRTAGKVEVEIEEREEDG